MTLARRTTHPVFVQGGPVACLVLHGFGGSPAEVRPIIEHLARKGFTVSAPLLPGHGATPAELRQTRARHWIRTAEAHLGRLQADYGPVHLVGFSMGGLIALYLAARHPVASVSTLAAPIHLSDPGQILAPLSRYLLSPVGGAQPEPDAERLPLPAIRSLTRLARLVRRDLGRVTAPLQAIQGDRDRWVAPGGAAYIAEHAASAARRAHVLPGRGHFVGLEREREEVAEMVAAWIEAHQA